jgi:BNR repeat-containing family member
MHWSLLIILLGMMAIPTGCAAAQPQKVIVFNDNGAWCWYQDPRVLVDRTNGTMLIASVAAAEGVDGKRRAGDVDLTTYTLATGHCARYVLHHGFSPPDDHDTAALLLRTDGRYLAAYSRHNADAVSYRRISVRPHDATEWGPELTFDWTDALATADATDKVTYNNLYYLAAEGRTYDFVRAVNHDPSILTSSDEGTTFTYANKLLTIPKLGYVNGYVRYTSNGVDRIDFITTEHHPRDFNNSIYHGYLQNGKLHRSDGTVVNDDIFNGPGHPQTELTKIFAADSMHGGDVMTHAWTMQIRLDPSDRPYALISCRANDEPENTNFSDHRFFYCWFDGKDWQVHELARAGACLWPAEQDYTGLATFNPNHLDEVFISSPIDPRDGSALEKHEIFKGDTANGGATWAWTPVTWNSPVDNLRPLATNIDGKSIALIWFRGTMTRSQHYNTQMVGIIE